MQDSSQEHNARTILKNARKIAIVGLSNDSQKPSYKVAEYLQKSGYEIIPIHPKGGEILGVRAYESLKDAFRAEAQIDIVNVFRKSEALPQVAHEVLELPYLPKCVWVQLGLESKEARALIEGVKIFYVEDLCLAIEHKRLCNDSDF